MAANDINVINHLIEIEKKADELVSVAQAEADKKISAARLSADSKFHEQFSGIISQNESVYAARTAEITGKYQKSMATYKNQIENASKNFEGFNSLVKDLLENKLFS